MFPTVAARSTKNLICSSSWCQHRFASRSCFLAVRIRANLFLCRSRFHKLFWRFRCCCRYQYFLDSDPAVFDLYLLHSHQRHVATFFRLRFLCSEIRFRCFCDRGCFSLLRVMQRFFGIWQCLFSFRNWVRCYSFTSTSRFLCLFESWRCLRMQFSFLA